MAINLMSESELILLVAEKDWQLRELAEALLLIDKEDFWLGSKVESAIRLAKQLTGDKQ